MPDDTRRPKLLITAGPTHEPIDAVRYIANRSSGRVGIALADAGARRGWGVTLLLGPVAREPLHTHVRPLRFTTAADLRELLLEHAPTCDALVMAAAVADFTPRSPDLSGKMTRMGGMKSLELVPTPDLLAEVAAGRRPGQIIVGFALEPAGRLLESARDKLRRKGADAIVANPLGTLDADTIDATIVPAIGPEERFGPLEKTAFAERLLDWIESRRSPPGCADRA